MLQDLNGHSWQCTSCPTLSDETLDRVNEVQVLIARGVTKSEGILHKLRGLDLCLMAMELV